MEEKILIEDIPSDLIDFANFVGIDMFIKICDYFGGNQVYFPKKESLLRGYRNRIIKQMYNGDNIYEICQKFKITKNQVKNILK